MAYYDGTRLLSQKDINGETPEIYISQANNSAGKTTWFNRWFVKRYKENGELFMLLYRFNYELDGVEEQFFGEIKTLFYPNDEMTAKKRDMGIYTELYLNDKLCGFAVSLNNADQVKRRSHLFGKVSRMLLDEFQSETNHYCPDELNKFWAVHKAVARGGGKQSRYVPVYLIGNPVTLLNPYYTAFGISSRLKTETKFLKGVGWVMEQGFNESASNALKESAFNRAMACGNQHYMDYSTQGVYLNDNDSFVEKLTGKSRYILTLVANGKSFAIREYPQYGYVYCDNSADDTFPNKIAISTADHNTSSILLAKSNPLIATLRKYFEHGLFRFKNLQCKEVILNLLSY